MMDTLRERLAEAAHNAPTEGAPAAELWARGKRAQRRRAAAVAATVLVVGAVGTGIGARLADGDGNRSDIAPAGTVDISLPIDYPEGEALPDLGATPGPLAAIWLPPPRAGATKLEVVGLVAETGTFGTLPLDLPDIPYDPEDPVSSMATVELSPDGRRVAYNVAPEDLVVHDLVSGEEHVSAGFEPRAGYTWVDTTHLLGLVAGGSDAEGWVWEPGSTASLVDFYSVPYGESGLSVPFSGWRCQQPPTLQDVQFRQENGLGWAGAFAVPVLCNVLSVTDSGLVLGRWRDPQDGNGTVVALDVKAADPPLGEISPANPSAAEFEDPALRQVVATPGGPERVSFATELIAQALDAAGGAS